MADSVPGWLREIAAVVLTLRGSVDPDSAFARVVDVHEALRLMLDLDVIEQSFGGFGHLVEQEVELVRFDGLCVSPLDTVPNRDRPSGKVAGVQLGHFGSFLKAAWRANDWMWGRLDGSQHIIEALLVMWTEVD